MTVAESLDIVAVQGRPCFIEFGHGSVGFLVGFSEEAEPATVEDWEQAVHPDGTTIVDINASIHDQYKLQSGSAMEEEDVLHLKAVWQNAESTNKSQAHSCENAGLPTLIRVWERTSSFCCWIVRS